MTVMSVRELNTNISRALARVEAGEVIEIARNGKIIAELRPKGIVRDAAWWEAYERSIEFMKKGLPLGIGKLTEEDKYGDDPL
jgi:antitoxin (DNA-binding transcriptional repressor) of toxin-antitoxin stability system